VLTDSLLWRFKGNDESLRSGGTWLVICFNSSCGDDAFSAYIEHISNSYVVLK
jgi:hypothetical protein